MRNFLTFLYRLVRPFQVVDVTQLMHWDEADSNWPVTPAGYRVRVIAARELDELNRRADAPELIGTSETIADGTRACVGVFEGLKCVSYMWVATGFVEDANNFSRSPHLGTSMDLPHGCGFVFNAWTDPEHRGKRLIGVLLGYVIRHRVLASRQLLTTMDWTNLRSQRAFGHFGMKSLGRIWRLGLSRCQLTLLPRVPDSLDLVMASDVHGLVLSPRKGSVDTVTALR
ncbi:MAG: hypothetical protein AAF989_02925 [Planctomycetota bacterium]